MKGQTLTDADGNRVEGFQVHLGGALGIEQNFGRKLKGHKVLASELGDYVVRVVENYKQQREEGESFAQWTVRADEEALS